MAKNLTLTPEQAYARLVSIFPIFAEQWVSPHNVFREDDGSFTFCGLFSEFSHYLRDHWNTTTKQKWSKLMAFIEVCVSGSGELDNAVCTCFLENLSNEPSLSEQLRKHMGSRSAAFFDQQNT